jgi:TfoX N-terminal domain
LTARRRFAPPGLTYDSAMAYDDALAERVRAMLGQESEFVEKKMFGGLGMLVGGNMAVGVQGDGLIVRVEPSEHDALLGERGARPFDLSGRPMKGWLVVGPEGCAKDADLRRWVKRGFAYARALPPK